MVFCSNCGLLLPAGTERCPRCGAPAPAPVPDAAPQPRYEGAVPSSPDSLSTGGYFLYLCLFGIPVIGFIIALVFAFRRRGNRARRRLARAAVLYILLVVGALLVLYIIAALVTWWAMLPVGYGPQL